MTREEAKETVKKELSCKDFLSKGKKSGYICPYCGSGTGANGTGAVKYYEETNTCTCFACKKSFDVFDLLQKENNCGYSEALAIGAERLRISIDNEQNAPQGTKSRRNDAKARTTREEARTAEKPAERATAADYTEYYKKCGERLQESVEAISYLTARGISLETAERCGVGYDPAADPFNFPGLTDDSVRPWYPVKRIILPSSKSHYVGRRIDGITEREKPNNKGGKPDVFNKEDLYRGYKTVFITEGAFDCMSIIEAGAAAVGLNSSNNGKALLSAIAEKKPTAKNFVICFDNDKDPATRARVATAAESLKTALNGVGYNSLIFDVCGQEKDPNAAMCANYKAFKERITAAITEAEKPAPDQLTDFLEEIQTERYKPYKTGLSFFDDLLSGGMMRQTTLFLLAPPAAGKTTLAQQLAEAIAKTKKPVIYFSFEMSKQQMLSKDISRRISVNKEYDFTMTAAEVLQGYNWNERQRAAVKKEIEKYREEIFPYLQYNPTTSPEIEEIKDYLSFIGEQAKAQGTEAPAIIIDYLHLIRSNKRTEVQDLLKEATQVFNDYVRKYDTIAVIISAINRESNKNAGASSGRDSSNIEYSAVYQVSLNYYEIECGIDGDPKRKVAVDSLEHEALKMQNWRHMILKLTKNRFGQAGRTQNVYFHSAGNAFYSEYGWLPVDPERTPFPTKTKRASTGKF